MAVWVLLGVGVLFAAVGGLNSLLKTLFRRADVSFFDLLLSFLATLILVVALIVTNLEASPDQMIGQFALYTAGGIAAFHILVTFLEIFRPQRLRGSRGLLGVFSAVLIALSTFTIPFIAVYFDLRADQTANQGVVGATTVADASSANPGEETASPEQQERFADLFRAIFGFVAAETDLPELEIVDQLEAGTPLAKIITDNGGDLNVVVSQIAEATREVVRESAAAGEINPVQAALAVSQMENFVRFLVNTDITRLGERVSSGTPDPNATRESLRSLFETPSSPTGETAPVAEMTTSVPPTTEPTETPTQLPTNTVAPTDSPTPRPTATPSATRFAFATRTPLPTLTPVTPCLASVEYNLRLRTAPNLDSETILVISYGETVELYGRGAPSGGDSFWWLANYDGTEGWLDGQYMIVSRGCDALPVVAR